MAVAKDGSSGWGAMSRQSEAMGRGIGAEQGEFQKTLLGFIKVSWHRDVERLGEVSRHPPNCVNH